MQRLGRVILIILASLGGLFVFSIIGLSLGLSHIFSEHGRTSSLPDEMVVVIDLEIGINENASPSGMGIISKGNHGYDLRKVISGIEAAAKDPKVKSLLLKLGNSGMSMSHAQELRAALAKFKKEGKTTAAFAESFGEGGSGVIDFYLASAMDKIWLQPSGVVAIGGFMLESPFLKGLLDKIGVKPSFERRHEYKSAPEMFTAEKFSPEAKESLHGLLKSWLSQVQEGIGEGRKLTPEALQNVIDNSPYLPEEALKLGLVDKLAYRDEVEEDALGEGDAEFIDIEDYQDRRPKKGGAKHKIALIQVNGNIVSGPSDDWNQKEMSGADTIVDAIKEAVEDEEIKAIVLRIDSPGGSYSAADAIHRAVLNAREQGKPVIASLGETAASGGYFAAMAANKIIANPGTIAGSIGVFSGKMVLTGLWEKLGVGWDEVHIGQNAGMWSANRDFTPQAKAKLGKILDQVYADFTNKAALARNLSPAEIDKAARGRVFTGKEALDIRLIDQLGGFREALNEAKKEAEIPENERVALVILPHPQGPLQTVLAMLKGGGAGLGLLSDFNSWARPLLSHIPSPRLRGTLLLWQPESLQ